MKFFKWADVELETMSDVISRKVISGEKAMVAQVFLKKDAVVPEHHHESEQITYILEGALKFELEGREVVVRKGEVLHIPSNVPHRAVALEDTLDLDIFSPPTGGLVDEERRVSAAGGKGRDELTEGAWFGVIKKPSSIVPR